MPGQRVLTSRIAVLGGGPAGSTVALGLTRLGYSVTLATQPRPFDALEGISERVLAGLRGAGFQHALHAIPEPTPRYAHWNGVSNQANTERLVQRASLDRAIQQDLEAGGVRVLSGRVQRVNQSEQGYQIDITGNGAGWQLNAEVLIEARGRRAPAPSPGSARRHGPATVSLLQRWQGPPLQGRSAVQSFADGWAWMATGSDGYRYLQLTLDTEKQSLPPRQDLASFCLQRLQQLKSAQAFLAGAHPVGPVVARASTPLLHRAAVADNWIRVGDAAMAVDPLSGNGIFQSLSSALLAPVVLNTLLHKPAQKELACAFYKQRLEHLFLRFARLGRDFYRMEERWPERDFWSIRATWPDNQPTHIAPDHSPPKVEQRAVVCDGYIEAQPVVITAEQPLGIWQVAGIKVAPLVEQLRRQPLNRQDNLAAQLRHRWPMSDRQAAYLLDWLHQHRLL
ncbi:MAG: tryptophan 7-halogenase [Candidatus Competibacteraceae bacterium]|nr:tryptophan 7-halogenase [Candidatus Competibacteraceae bacterium]